MPRTIAYAFEIESTVPPTNRPSETRCTASESTPPSGSPGPATARFRVHGDRVSFIQRMTQPMINARNVNKTYGLLRTGVWPNGDAGIQPELQYDYRTARMPFLRAPRRFDPERPSGWPRSISLWAAGPGNSRQARQCRVRSENSLLLRIPQSAVRARSPLVGRAVALFPSLP
jgi:hypothetical protein